jgi:hypothetical protein
LARSPAASLPAANATLTMMLTHETVMASLFGSISIPPKRKSRAVSSFTVLRTRFAVILRNPASCPIGHSLFSKAIIPNDTPVRQYKRSPGRIGYKTLQNRRISGKIKKDFYKRYNQLFDQKVSLPKSETEINRIMERLDIKPPLSINKTSVWRIDATDGFKFILKGGSWLAIRPSSTERLIRIYAEAPDEKLPAILIKEGKKIIEGIV